MPTVTARAPAKINLALSVGPRRADGYHELATVFQAVTLYDEVVVRPADDVRVTVEGFGAERVPLGDDNLAARAARALSSYAGVGRGVHLHLRKCVPVAGGMGGGSADAAAALVACDALWGTGLGRGELDVLAARLGSDVPFALHGGTAVGTGRGEQLTPALAAGTYHWVVGVADGGLATPDVYRELDRQRARATVADRDPEVPDALLVALRAGSPDGVARALVNDLQVAAVALHPSLARTLEVGLEHGALAGVVSGSGPTCVFLARDREAALEVEDGLAAAGVCRHVLRVTAPAPGARVVAS
jgi:4-diphosphocytidyl-2-C-methyl-D-erythritol kinase